MTKAPNLKNVRKELYTFLENLKTVQLATLDNNGLPEASYAPFVKNQNAYYLFLSDLARHSINLKLNAAISLLFIEDESKSQNLFSRRRVILQGRAKIITRETETYTAVLPEFKRIFGSLIDVIEPLQDFNLYKISPTQGRYIRGFAQAFELSGKELDQVEHINPGA